MRRYLLIVLITVSFFFCAQLGVRAYLSSPFAVQKQLTIQVPIRHRSADVVSALFDQKLIKHPLFTTLVLHLVYRDDSFRPGEYTISSGDTLSSLISRILAGSVLRRRFLIIEGWTIQQVLDKLSEDPTITHTLQGISSTHLLEALGLGVGPAEGLFFPDTYFYHRGVSDKRLLLMSYHTMQHVLQKEWKQHAKGLTYTTAYQALIVASLIEKETASSEERPLVASVINNRLKKGMRLQIDPTVVYGSGAPYGVPLTHAMLKKNTPFNTYRHRGLPPTPIALPSRASIKAACHPAKSKALYYVYQGNGRHAFSRSYHQHLKGVSVLRHEEAKEKHQDLTLSSWRSFMCLSVLVSESLGRPHFSFPLSQWLCREGPMSENYGIIR